MKKRKQGLMHLVEKAEGRYEVLESCDHEDSEREKRHMLDMRWHKVDLSKLSNHSQSNPLFSVDILPLLMNLFYFEMV